MTVFAIDTDQDGIEDQEELMRFATNPKLADSDGDGYDDLVELQNGYSPLTPEPIPMHKYDHDGDGLNYWLETMWFRTSPYSLDSDGDGFDDWTEVMGGYDPTEPNGQQKFEREILVDRTHQRLYFIVDGVKIENYPVSTGNPHTPTPAGEYHIQRMIEKKNYVGADYFVPDVWWNMLFKEGGYYIHGTYWHNDFGIRTHSHGCVNMTNDDAKELYSFVEEGMKVTIVGETPSGYHIGT